MKFQQVEINSKLDEINKLQEIDKRIEDMIKFGGFPDVVLHKDISDEILSSYFETIVLNAIRRYKVRDERKLRVLAKFYVTSTASRVTYNSVADFLGIPVKTVERYSTYLERVYLIFFLNNFFSSSEKSPKKVFVTDNGFVKIFSPKMRGRLFETLIAQHVYSHSLRNRAELYYWYEEVEVDLVYKGEKVVPIQVSYDITDEGVLIREVEAIKRFEKKYNVKEGFLVFYRGEEKEVDNVKLVPARKFLLHLEEFLS